MKHILTILTAVMLSIFLLSSAVMGYPGYGSGSTDSSGTTTSTVPEDDSKITNIFPGEIHFANMQMLTIEGENAEAYWNSDGTKLILQAHVGNDACDQIYIMDLETGDTEMVSTGKGVTTCSYFKYPLDDKILYCSTHLKHDACPEKVNRMKGYVWKLYPEFDVFTADPDGSNLVQLTDSWGYDAEAAFAHDGTSIVFCSLASGDLDIWTMDPDGSNKKQVTDGFGYDGGPFFSWDSTKIVWRAYYPDTEKEIDLYKSALADDSIRRMPLQIWYMDADGGNKVQVTDNGDANFCPFFVPGDDRIIYTSNHNSKMPMDFNLWIVDIDGNNAEQLTFYSGFDAFPMFSPDGTKLVFASNRNQKTMGSTNIFLCDWVE